MLIYADHLHPAGVEVRDREWFHVLKWLVIWEAQSLMMRMMEDPLRQEIKGNRWEESRVDQSRGYLKMEKGRSVYSSLGLWECCDDLWRWVCPVVREW